jgi:hypothetical protein
MNSRGRFSILLGIALASACGGTTANPPAPGNGGSGTSSGGSGSGGSCSSCSTDQDCQNGCGAPPQGNVWCCISSSCYGNGARCSSSTGSGVGPGLGGGPGGGLGAILPGLGTGPIACGTAGTCTAPNVCCAGGGAGRDTCTSLMSCVGNGSIYTCTGQANCTAPQVCCLTTGTGLMGTDFAICQPTCGTGRGLRSGRSLQVCQTSSECQSGQTCAMNSSVAMKVCQ